MLVRPQSRRRAARAGTYVVEFAMILPIFLLFVFGIFEYGRYVAALQACENAAREGVRFAVVNTYSPTVEADTIAFTRRCLARADLWAFGGQANIDVYAADSAGTQIGDTPRDASFGENVAVRVSGSFRPLVNFRVNTFFGTVSLFTSGIKIDSRALMNSEAN